jgi:FkbM family methyltransferase
MKRLRIKSLRNQINRLFAKSGWQFISRKTLERFILPNRAGLAHLDLYHCLGEIIAPNQMSCCLDVGANIGQTATKFRAYYPNSTIYCFEPVSDSYESLRAATESDSKIQCFQYAVSNKSGENVQIHLHPDSQCHSLRISPHSTGAFEIVESVTVDSFQKSNSLPIINLLKSDTEGFDVEVLQGAKDSLSAGLIQSVYVEVCFDPSDRSHSDFFAVAELLEECGLSFFGLFEQSTRQNPHRLFYANALFISRQLK